MGKRLVTDELWEATELPLPKEPPKPKGGRPRLPDRAALAGIIFVLKGGIPWEMLPQEMGCGSGSTCWRRPRDWEEAGVRRELHRVLLDRLGEADEIDWERASSDSASVPAKRGARKPARTRRIGANRARSATLYFGPKGSPARDSPHRHQRPRLQRLRGPGGRRRADQAPPGRGRPRKRPAKLHADKGYDAKKCRKALRKRGIKSRIAKRGKESSERLGRHRWVVESARWGGWRGTAG